MNLFQPLSSFIRSPNAFLVTERAGKVQCFLRADSCVLFVANTAGFWIHIPQLCLVFRFLQKIVNRGNLAPLLITVVVLISGCLLGSGGGDSLSRLSNKILPFHGEHSRLGTVGGGWGFSTREGDMLILNSGDVESCVWAITMPSLWFLADLLKNWDRITSIGAESEVGEKWEDIESYLGLTIFVFGS